MIKKMLGDLTNEFARGIQGQYWQRMFSEPLIISAEENQQSLRPQKVVRKFIHGFVLDYDRWEYLMPLSLESRRVVHLFQAKPHRCGSYRVDTVFDQKFQQKIIETTYRFALNGFFISCVLNFFTLDYQANRKGGKATRNRFTEFYPYLTELIGKYRKIIVLRSSDGGNASKYFIPIFEQMGCEMVIITPGEINNRLEELNDGFVISELTTDEIETLPDAVLDRLIVTDMINDLRTVILVHDKRFYDVLGQTGIREAILSQEEIQLLDEFYVPTYRFGGMDEYWEEARTHKNGWILKHRNLGKSQEIFAGPLCSEDEWADLFTQFDIGEFIIQRWVIQPLFSGEVKGVKHSDYVTGTLLHFNDQYFGPGIFRTSSCPVSNKTDDRKMRSYTLAPLAE